MSHRVWNHPHWDGLYLPFWITGGRHFQPLPTTIISPLESLGTPFGVAKTSQPSPACHPGWIKVAKPTQRLTRHISWEPSTRPVTGVFPGFSETHLRHLIPFGFTHISFASLDSVALTPRKKAPKTIKKFRQLYFPRNPKTLVSRKVLSQIKPQAPLLVVPFRQFLYFFFFTSIPSSLLELGHYTMLQ